MSKLIFGVGTNSRGKYKSKIDGKVTKAHLTWYNMLRRAYCPKYQAKQPTYIGCSVSDEWLEYQNFAEWFDSHDYSNRGYHLDKDLLIPGNKIYAPDRCVFVPRELNNLLTDHGNARGQYVQGVRFHKRVGKFVASVGANDKYKHLGCFDTEIGAYQAYKKAKEAHVKNMVNHWKGDIADEIYHALMLWELPEYKELK